MPRTNFSGPDWKRGVIPFGSGDGIGGPNGVFSLTAVREIPDRTGHIKLDVQYVGEANLKRNPQLAEAWTRAGVLPKRRTEEYTPILTREHIFGPS